MKNKLRFWKESIVRKLPEDVVCEHGVAMDVHCCNCHSGFLFDIEQCVCEWNGERKMSEKFRARKRPIEIEMIQWNNNEAQIRDFIKDDALLRFTHDNKLELWNQEEQSWINCPMFHFIARGIKGEIYPISPEVFERTYDVVD